MDRVDCIVVGAGVIGLAVARALAQKGLEVIIVEKAGRIGSGTSARNSEVIHAGIYYPPGSAKARLCVEGKHKLYGFCATHNVPHKVIGKLIVAANESQTGELEAIRLRAAENGVEDLVLLSKNQALADQPELQCAAALLSPSTGIIDSHGFMAALLGDAEDASATLALWTEVTSVKPQPSGFAVSTQGAVPFEVLAGAVVNAAGLGAASLARKTAGLDRVHVPQDYLAKGNYFRLTQSTPFSRLIYPVPEPGGLGVHITMDLGGQARFGPDVEWVGDETYMVDPARGDRFYTAVRRFWPGLPDGALEPDFCGIRPKISGPGEPAADFVISDSSAHRIDGLINLFGIESPGLTAALAIADDVRDRLT